MKHKLFILALLLGSLKAFSQDTTAFEYTDPGDPMPSFLLKTMGDTLYTQDDFKSSPNLFIMLFNPSCSHCQEETKILEKNIALFKKTKIILMAKPMMRSYLPDFFKETNAQQYAPEITIGIDSLHFMHDVSLEQQLPQINIYNKSRKLVKIFEGEQPIDTLKHYIQ